MISCKGMTCCSFTLASACLRTTDLQHMTEVKTSRRPWNFNQFVSDQRMNHDESMSNVPKSFGGAQQCRDDGMGRSAQIQAVVALN